MSFYGRVKSRWRRSYSAVSDTVSEDYLGRRAPKGVRVGIMGLLIVLLLLTALGWYWSAEPESFDVRPSAAQSCYCGARCCDHGNADEGN